MPASLVAARFCAVAGAVIDVRIRTSGSVPAGAPDRFSVGIWISGRDGADEPVSALLSALGARGFLALATPTRCVFHGDDDDATYVGLVGAQTAPFQIVIMCARDSVGVAEFLDSVRERRRSAIPRHPFPNLGDLGRGATSDFGAGHVCLLIRTGVFGGGDVGAAVSRNKSSGNRQTSHGEFGDFGDFGKANSAIQRAGGVCLRWARAPIVCG